jgi:hypothetical protein
MPPISCAVPPLKFGSSNEYLLNPLLVQFISTRFESEALYSVSRQSLTAIHWFDGLELVIISS